MINLKNISKIYNQGLDNEVKALNSVSLDFEKGDMISVMGRSGSGKSTLLHILSGLDSPTSGSYSFNGSEITEMNGRLVSRFRNRQIGVVIQDFALIDNQSALSNVKLPMYFDKTPLPEMKRKAVQALEAVDMAAFADRAVNAMSGGQKQRVAIARALVNSPELLLADEPTGALDSSTAKEIMDVLTRLNTSGMTVIIVTHDKEVASYCTRHIEISDGTIINDM